jgi:hypothetical protein
MSFNVFLFSLFFYFFLFFYFVHFSFSYQYLFFYISAEELIFSSELLEQRIKVQKEYIKLQTLIDNKIPDTSFLWSPDSNWVNIIDDIFRKTKRIREIELEDVVGKNCINIRFQIDDSECSQSSDSPNGVVFEVEGTESPPSFVPYNSIFQRLHQIHLKKIGGGAHNISENVPGIQNSPKAEVSESTSDIQGFVKSNLPMVTTERTYIGCFSELGPGRNTGWLPYNFYRFVLVNYNSLCFYI